VDQIYDSVYRCYVLLDITWLVVYLWTTWFTHTTFPHTDSGPQHCHLVPVSPPVVPTPLRCYITLGAGTFSRWVPLPRFPLPVWNSWRWVDYVGLINFIVVMLLIQFALRRASRDIIIAPRLRYSRRSPAACLPAITSPPHRISHVILSAAITLAAAVYP